MVRKIFSGIAAGIMIAIGGSVFLSCDTKWVGAILFSVALLTICYQGYALFTGKIGFIPEKHDKEAVSVLLLGLLGNFIATVVLGLTLRYAVPNIGTAAEAACAARMEQALVQTLIRAIFCGILMYTAVSIYRDHKTITGILFCIPVFILSGFEHSIADMFYFAAAGMISGHVILFILIVLVGNAIGGMLFPILLPKKGN